MKRIILGTGLIIILMLTLGIARAQEQIQKVMLPTSRAYFLIKAKESLQLNLTAFKKTTKAKVIENFTDQRINEIEYAASINNDEAIPLSLARYEIQKNKSFEYTKNANDNVLIEQVRERTQEQQRTMTKLQIKLENKVDIQQNIISTQQKVAVETKNTVEVVLGQDEATKTEQATKEIWYAPGTSGQAPPAGWIYEGGASQVIEGNGSGGSAESDIQQNVIQEGNSGSSSGSQQNQVIEEGGSSGQPTDGGTQYSPGTESITNQQ